MNDGRHAHTHSIHKMGNQIGYNEAQETEDGHKKAYVVLRLMLDEQNAAVIFMKNFKIALIRSIYRNLCTVFNGWMVTKSEKVKYFSLA